MFSTTDATITILNSSFLSNTALGGNGATNGGSAFGGAIEQAGGGKLILFNSTLGQNTAQGGNGTGTFGTQGRAFGGGLAAQGNVPQLFNNTIVFNQALNGTGITVVGIPPGGGGGIYSPAAGNLPSTLNNLVQGNTTSGVGPDLDVGDVVPRGGLGPFNVVGGSILQIAPTVTVVNGLPIYPLLPNATLAIQTGNTSVVAAIAAAEGVAIAKATDEVGNPRTTGNGSQIDLGAVQLRTVNSPPAPPSPPPAPPPPPTMSQAVIALVIDAFELVLSLNGFGPLLHLPPVNDLVANIGANLPFADGLGLTAVIFGANAANQVVSNASP